MEQACEIDARLSYFFYSSLGFHSVLEEWGFAFEGIRIVYVYTQF